MKPGRVDIDLVDLPYDDNSFDVFIGIHVIEHIRDDDKALSEIKRVTREFAILPVPTFEGEDKELDEPDEHGHIRHTTLEYYKKYDSYFPFTRIHTSLDFSDIFQTKLLFADGTSIAETIPVSYLRG